MRQLRRNRDKGTALVEFALSATVILAVLFGIIDGARALYAYDWVANAARKGTRFMIVRGTFCANNPMPLPGGCPATKQNVDDYIKNTNGNGLDVTGIDTSKVVTNTTCFWVHSTGAPPPCAPGGWVKVSVTYTFSFITPFLRVLPLHSWPMESSSQVIVQN